MSRTNSSRLPFARCIHSSPSTSANPLPITGTGPAPAPPVPAASQYGERVERRRRQAEMIKQSQAARQAQVTKPVTALKKRFWKHVSVQTAPDGQHTVHLDSRAIRHPTTRSTLHIPRSKPHLATAIALEWDLLTSAAQALKSHLIPLTSTTARAVDIAMQDAGDISGKAREEIVTTLMRYLDTDTLLCWAPKRSIYDPRMEELIRHEADKKIDGTKREGLRDQQVRVAREIISFLTEKVWPGVKIEPVLEGDSIIPAKQPQETKDVIRGWVSGLPAWELAGLERAVLAGKSLCVGARLVVEWSEAFCDIHGKRQGPKFGIDEACHACSMEVRWQTGMWGEVEDTHDVEKEDLKQQMGSVVLLVSGVGEH